MLGDLDIRGKTILDIGCGFGGPAMSLVRDHGAEHVTAIDIEPLQIEQTTARAATEGLSDQVTCQLVVPGALPFENETFDVVFSKGAIVHVKDKTALYCEIFRVLKPGGSFVYDDWLKRGFEEDSADLLHFGEKIGVTMNFESLERLSGMLTQAGFQDVSVDDRRLVHLEQAKSELENMQNGSRERFVAALGEELADADIECWQAMIKVLQSGEFGDAHLRAVKPD